MKYESKEIAISQIGTSLKNAALYYKHVIPMYVKAELNDTPLTKLLPPARGFSKRTSAITSEFDSIWPECKLMTDQEKYAYVFYKSFELMLICGMINENLLSREKYAQPTFRLLSFLYDPHFAEVMFTDSKDKMKFPIMLEEILKRGFKLSHEKTEFIYKQLETSDQKNLIEFDPCFILTQIKLIDAEKLSWDQILSIRNDPDSVRKLRRLRTFMFEEFNGKPITYIEDKLGTMMEDYERTARKYGAMLEEATLSLISSKDIIAATCAGLVAAVAGAAGAAVPLATALGATKALGNYLIQIRTIRKKKDDEHFESPVSYFMDIQKKIS